MKKNTLCKIKDVFQYMTLIWSCIMMVVYLICLFEMPVFAWISFLPLGDFVYRVLEFLMLSGIWGVPFFYIITIILMIIAHRKEQTNRQKNMKVATILLPIILAILMLATNFNEVLS